MIWIILILMSMLIAVLAWREVQILIDRGSWKAEDHKKIFWYIDWKSKWKNFDSFHVSNGIAVLIICYIVAENYQVISLPFLNGYQVIALTVVYWIVFMQIRNLIMKIL